MNFLSVINPYGMAIAAVLVLPYIFYRRRHKINKADYSNPGMYYIDRMGRFGSLFLLSFHLGVLERGFTEPKELMQRFWLISTAALLIVYLLLWGMFFKRERKHTAYLIVAVSAVIIVFSGILQVNTLLFTFGFVYLIGELYVVKQHFK